NATYTPVASEFGTTVTLTWNIPDLDGSGPCTASSDNLQLIINSPAIAFAGFNQTICGNGSATLAATPATGGTWTGGAGTFAPNRNTANAVYTPASGEIGTTITLT